MALNTNLRCGRIGEDGKALNVVTAELRNFAAQLDATAGKVLSELTTLESAAEKLTAGQDENGGRERLDDLLARAMGSIRAVGDRIDREVGLLSEQSGTAIDQIEQSLLRLEFNSELGDVLRNCARDISVPRSEGAVETSHPSFVLLGSRISAVYTMASERELYAEVFGTAPLAIVTPIATAMSDDDLEDALF